MIALPLRLLIALSIVVICTGRTAAEVTPAKGGGVLNPAGEPEDYREGKQAIYALWHQDGAWHIQAAGRTGQQERFTGEITIVKGKILSGEYQGLELAPKTKKAKGKKPKNSDLLWLSEDHHKLQFELNSIGKSDSFSFKVSPQATEIEFKVLVNGAQLPDRVFIGKSGQHPEKLPLVLKANP